jgi:hypothetical protein
MIEGVLSFHHVFARGGVLEYPGSAVSLINLFYIVFSFPHICTSETPSAPYSRYIGLPILYRKALWAILEPGPPYSIPYLQKRWKNWCIEQWFKVYKEGECNHSPIAIRPAYRSRAPRAFARCVRATTTSASVRSLGRFCEVDALGEDRNRSYAALTRKIANDGACLRPGAVSIPDVGSKGMCLRGHG